MVENDEIVEYVLESLVRVSGVVIDMVVVKLSLLLSLNLGIVRSCGNCSFFLDTLSALEHATKYFSPKKQK